MFEGLGGFGFRAVQGLGFRGSRDWDAGIRVSGLRSPCP